MARGAQVRNVTLRDGRLWRIDFEENIGGALSLPLAQAYDLYQTLASLVSLRKLPPEQASHLGKLVLDTYFAAHPDSEVRAHAAHRAPDLRRRPLCCGRWAAACHGATYGRFSGWPKP